MTTTATTDALKGSRIAILGYGSQGRAHALNLHDSGLDVVVGVRKGGPSWDKAQADGLRVAEPADAVKEADLVAVLTPDMVQPALYNEAIAPNLKANAALLFAHGFNVHFGQIQPRKDIDVILVAPKGPGALVRREYEKGHGVPCLYAIHQDASGQARDKVLAYAAGIGGARAMLIETTFAEETETDLFGEQAVLCGGATELVLQGFETLVEAGYKPEVAYYECLHELKLIVDLLHEGGLAKMHQFVSRDRAIRRPHPRPAGHQRRNPQPHARSTRRDPGRPLRQGMGRRVPGRQRLVPRDEGTRPGASDRADRRDLARTHAVVGTRRRLIWMAPENNRR